LDDFLVILPFFQSLSPIVYLAIALLNQKKKIDYFFQIYEIQVHISRKNPNYNVIYLFRHISAQYDQTWAQCLSSSHSHI